MKKIFKKATAYFLVLAMVCATFLTELPSLDTLAAPIYKTMAHLKAGTDNGNGHFSASSTTGNSSPEAFVLSDDATVTDEDISVTLKLVSAPADSRVRIVTKYVDDSNWSYIGFDKGSGWFVEYNNNGTSSWQDLTGLPSASAGDILEITGNYGDDGFTISAKNTTANTAGTAIATAADFLALKERAGKIGFGASQYSNAITEIYFTDVTAGDRSFGGNNFAGYEKSASGYTYEPEMQVQVGDDGLTEEVVESRKWIVLSGGSNNSGGHNYGDGTSRGPLFYTDTEKTMTSGGTISMALKPSNNWGVFYNYIDDNNWLYVGYDSSSKWYYQYKWNGSESYPQISGLPDAVEGEELNLTISLSNETLAVTVDGTTAYVTNQTLKDYAAALTEANGNMGKFGVMTKGATTISFADFKYEGADCMSDTWAFNAQRDGQTMREEYTAVEVVRGTVTAANGAGIAGATVRIGAKSATTAADGTYAIANVQVGNYALAVSKAGYQAYTADVEVIEDGDNTFNAVLERKAALDLSSYDTISTEDMTVYIGKDFPVVARYVMNSDATGETFFRGNETNLNTVVINGHAITPTVTVKETVADARTYTLDVVDTANSIDLVMDVKISAEANTLTWEVTELTKNEGCEEIATIDIPELNLLSVDATETESEFAGAQVSTTTTSKADKYITFEDGFIPSNTDGYVYAFLSNGKLSAGLHSNSEVEGDKRVERINGADNMSLTSAVWYYERGDKGGQAEASYDYPVSELPQAKVAIASDLNKDNKIDWNDGAIAFRDVMHYAQDTEVIKDMVNYRIVMNFESAAPNPFLATADNIKKVYLATDGLPQAVMLKGYGNEGHDSANSEYADISERAGGVEDFQDLIKIAHDYNTEIGIHVNAQEAYPESRSFNETMISTSGGALNGNGWGWLDQSTIINKLWDLSSNARLKRFVQLYDRINGTDFYSGDWEEREYVKDSQGFFTNGDGVTEVSREEVLELIKADAAARKDNMDFIYLDVWYQDAWETRRIAEEIHSLGWRFSTEFSAEGEYDSTWQHWSTDTTYGGAGMKGYNSDIIRFLRNDQRDSQVLNWPDFGGTADNPLLGGYRLYGFEGWGGDQDFNNYIWGTFDENLPTKFLQQYEIIDWENYGDDGSDDVSPVGNTEKEITLANDEGDVVVVTRNEEQRDDIEIERVITLNGKVVLNTDADSSEYLLPWIDDDNGEEKLYHWNLDGGTTTWELQEDWANLANVVVYKLTDQGRVDKTTVNVVNGSITLEAEASTAYVVVKGEAAVKTLKADFGEYDYVVDPGFNGYAGKGESLDAAEWSGDIDNDGVKVVNSDLGDQRLEMTNTSDDVSVTTTISGLTVGKDYVAEIYVDNQSDAKATITVDAGNEVVSNYTERSFVRNSVNCDNEHGSMMQRIQVSFVAEAETAEFTLTREAGEGYTHWDDIRIVEQKVDNYKENGRFEQDFESVVQGLYPFVLGGVQYGGDSRTHLSQANAPYTETGWNGRVIDDTIDGEWSLKHHTRVTGIVYQTIPQNFRFEPGKVYTVKFDYQAGSTAFQMVVGNGTTYAAPTEYLPETMNGLGTQPVEMQVVGAGNGQTWIGLYENGNLLKVNSKGEILPNGESDFILDNLVIKVDEDAVAVTVSDTDLYLGETAEIYGSSLDKITWTVSEEGVVSVDKENNKIDAIGTGTVTVTATYEGETIAEFTMTVRDNVMVDFEESELSGNMGAEANSAQSNYGDYEGPAEFAVDGNSSTYWHTAWSGFTVSESNPAVLTVDLGQEMTIGGFKFQQRATGGNNGMVYQYKYAASTDGVNYTEWSDVITTANPTNGEWEIAAFAQDVDARYIKIAVVEGHNGYAAIAEVLPMKAQRVTEEVTLADATVKAGEKVTLEPQHEEGTVLKGLVWTSSDESVATVNSNGVVTGVKAGTVTITLSNATGELATCTVTVTGEAQPPVDSDEDVEAPTAPTNLKVTKTTKDSVTITWDAATDNVGVEGYLVYVNGELLEGYVTETEATIVGLAAGTTYEIKVVAFDAAENVSDAATVTATTKSDTTDEPGKDEPSKDEPATDSPKLESPETGDASPITLLVVVMALAVVVVFVQKRRMAK